uniref:MerR family transcriptional regulator n=1 Tax=Tepidimonas sp. TaxID=2002775 RepID=UPI002FE33EB8
MYFCSRYRTYPCADFHNAATPPTDRSHTQGPAPLWTIADVERETGIGKDTLRVWERRYGFPVPRRDERGDRLYDAKQLARLRLIRRLLDAGHRPGRVVRLSGAALEALATTDGAARPAVTADGGPDALAPWMDWLRADEIARVRAGLREAVRVRGLADTVESLVAPLCVAVGDAWLRGELSVYQEHLFTEVVQAVLREAMAEVEQTLPQALRRPRVVLTTTPGEPHQLGLLMAECFFVLQGCERLTLGVCTPVADIADAARRTQADIVGVSFSVHASRRDVLDAVTALRVRLPPTVPLWVGGGGAQRPLRRPPAGVLVLRRAADVATHVLRWREQHGHAPSSVGAGQPTRASGSRGPYRSARN